MSAKDEIKRFVKSKIRQICQGNDGRTSAVLANLRRGIGRAPGEMPVLWGIILDDMPEEMLSRTGEPSRAEWACYTALTLFALHQQGHDCQSDCMSQEGRTLGSAVRSLAKNDDELEAVRRRFNVAATSSDMTELAQHLRSVVQLLRSSGIALDYPALAADLFDYQFDDRISAVRLRWGQDFYRIYNED